MKRTFGIKKKTYIAHFDDLTVGIYAESTNTLHYVLFVASAPQSQPQYLFGSNISYRIVVFECQANQTRQAKSIAILQKTNAELIWSIVVPVPKWMVVEKDTSSQQKEKKTII